MTENQPREPHSSRTESDSTAVSQQHHASRSRWLALAVLVLPVFILSVDMTVLGFALPEISSSLSPSGTQLLWIVDIYGFLIAGFLVTMGTLGDRIGRKRLLMIGVSVFGLASLMAALSTTSEMLILARALMGIGGATLMPSTLAMIRNVFPIEKERRMAVAVWSAMWGGGTAAGPIIGGFLLEHFWWGSVFVINLPVVAFVLILAPGFIPESKNPRPGKIDPPSILMSISSILLLVYSVKHTAEEASLDAVGIACFVLGALLLVLFIRRQNRMDNPMLDLGLFKRSSFSTAVAVNCIIAFSFVGLMFFIPQYLQLIRNLSPLSAALWILPTAVASVIVSLVAPKLMDKFPPGHIIIVGLLIAALGLSSMIFIGVETALPLIAVSGILMGTGLGSVDPVSNDMVVVNVPESRAGAASALSETAVELGSALGTAILGSIATAVYAARVKANAPEGMDTDLVQRASQTLGSALTVSEKFPETLQAQFQLIADNAFLDGMHTAMAIAVILPLIAVFIVKKFLVNPGKVATKDRET